ncbi:MAG: peptidoglycan-binding protein [Lachnospiraceae bacterium]|nr:peptidoglycan-binding protein [Lachnospiraceae bacterium]
MAVSQVGSTTTSYYMTTGASSSTTASTTASTTSNVSTSSAISTSSSVSATSNVGTVSSTTAYSSATAQTTCSTTITYSGSSSTAKVSSTTASTTVVSNSSGTPAVTVTNGGSVQNTSSMTLQNKIDDSILRIKSALYKEIGMYVRPYYPTSASTTALSQTMTGLMVDIGKESTEEDSIKYAKIVLREMNFYKEDATEISEGKLSDEYNNNLEQAVKRFQTLFQLSVTGEINEATWKEIHNQLYDGYAFKRENNKQVLTEALSSIVDENGVKLVKERYYTEESINELLDTITEFGIDDDKELKVFLAQTLHECLSDADGIENAKKNWKYAGAGAIQLTGVDNYRGFAIYEIIRQNTELEANKLMISPANRSSDEVLANYNKLIGIAENKDIDISKYTDIVDIGKKYVAENYLWRSAGWYWMTNKIGEKIEGMTAEEGMVVSKKVINSNEEGDAYENRLKKLDYIEVVSSILEGILW